MIGSQALKNQIPESDQRGEQPVIEAALLEGSQLPDLTAGQQTAEGGAQLSGGGLEGLAARPRSLDVFFSRGVFLAW